MAGELRRRDFLWGCAASVGSLALRRARGQDRATRMRTYTYKKVGKLSIKAAVYGADDAARPVLHEWQQVEPTNAELQIYLAVVEQRPSGEAADDTADRQFRVDAGTSTLAGVLPILPIVSQATSADSMAQPDA